MILGLLLLFSIAAVAFCAGYATRELISRKRRAEYLKFKPYVTAPRAAQPPAFLVRSANTSQRKRTGTDG